LKVEGSFTVVFFEIFGEFDFDVFDAGEAGGEFAGEGAGEFVFGETDGFSS
jgi:hypothetical protein